MAGATTRVKRWGNSLGVIIPVAVAREQRLEPGDLVQIEIARRPAMQGFGIARGARPFQHEPEGHEEFR